MAGVSWPLLPSIPDDAEKKMPAIGCQHSWCEILGWKACALSTYILCWMHFASLVLHLQSCLENTF